jgi:hypothetical protein
MSVPANPSLSFLFPSPFSPIPHHNPTMHTPITTTLLLLPALAAALPSSLSFRNDNDINNAPTCGTYYSKPAQGGAIPGRKVAGGGQTCQAFSDAAVVVPNAPPRPPLQKRSIETYLVHFSEEGGCEWCDIFRCVVLISPSNCFVCGTIRYPVGRRMVPAIDCGLVTLDCAVLICAWV